jgi:hypothetical protein
VKEEGTPIYGSPISNKARAAASRVRYVQLKSLFNEIFRPNNFLNLIAYVMY